MLWEAIGWLLIDGLAFGCLLYLIYRVLAWLCDHIEFED